MIAGEASADLHGSALLKDLRERFPELQCFGIGGKALEANGMHKLADASDINIVGVSALFGQISRIYGVYKKIIRSAKTTPYDFAVLIDLPDFNLRVARQLKKLGVPVFYYVSPQVWAWRTYRVNSIRRDVACMYVLFPFEKEFYDRYGVESLFVGHPLTQKLPPRLGIRSQPDVQIAPRIALLPGSRRGEVAFHGPILRATAEKIRARFPQAQFRVPVASTLSLEFVRTAIPDPAIQLESGEAESIVRWADIAVVASGTATLETALIGTPFCLLYKVGTFNRFLHRLLVRHRGFIGMPNLLLGEEVAREFFQAQATDTQIAQECIRLLEDASARAALREKLIHCHAILRAPAFGSSLADSMILKWQEFNRLLPPKPLRLTSAYETP